MVTYLSISLVIWQYLGQWFNCSIVLTLLSFVYSTQPETIYHFTCLLKRASYLTEYTNDIIYAYLLDFAFLGQMNSDSTVCETLCTDTLLHVIDLHILTWFSVSCMFVDKSVRAGCCIADVRQAGLVVILCGLEMCQVTSRRLAGGQGLVIIPASCQSAYQADQRGNALCSPL